MYVWQCNVLVSHVLYIWWRCPVCCVCNDTTVDMWWRYYWQCCIGMYNDTIVWVLSAMASCVFCTCAGQEMSKAALGTEIPQDGRWVFCSFLWLLFIFVVQKFISHSFIFQTYFFGEQPSFFISRFHTGTFGRTLFWITVVQSETTM